VEVIASSPFIPNRESRVSPLTPLPFNVISIPAFPAMNHFICSPVFFLSFGFNPLPSAMELPNIFSSAASILCIIAFFLIIAIVIYKHTATGVSALYYKHFVSSKSKNQIAYTAALHHYQVISSQTEILQTAWQESLAIGCRWKLQDEKLLRRAVETSEMLVEALRHWEAELDRKIWDKNLTPRWARKSGGNTDLERGVSSSGRVSRKRSLSTAQMEFFRRLADREELSMELKLLHSEILSK
jgi:hypothetical protein